MNKMTPPDPRHVDEPGSAASTLSNLALACSAEAIGTFLLVLVGTAVATAAVLGKNTAGPAYDSLAVCFRRPGPTIPSFNHPAKGSDTMDESPRVKDTRRPRRFASINGRDGPYCHVALPAGFVAQA